MLEFTHNDLDYFIEHIYKNDFGINDGGMGAPDLFTLWFVLNKYKPKVVVESGVWNGLSTELIRKTLPNSKIICLDPRQVPSYGFLDKNENTSYYTGSNFIDFEQVDLSAYNKDELLCFFDCHQNACNRVSQCINKKVKYIFLNDNYPSGCGSHYTLKHMLDGDNRLCTISNDMKTKVKDHMYYYHVFPNIYPGRIKTGEGYFECKSYFNDIDKNDNLYIFEEQRNRYRCNTFVILN